MLTKLKNIVKNLLAVAMIRRIFETLTRGVLEVFASNRVFATLYGILNVFTFNRERYAVLKGQRNYYRNLKKVRRNRVELRRNIHRLEKGLIMVPQKPVFAGDYISETIDYYEQAVKQYIENKENIDLTELQWAHDVLKQYFNVVETNNKVVNNANRRFEATLKTYDGGQESKMPYLSRDRIQSHVAFDDLLMLSRQRRSIRWFQQKKVPRQLVDQALLVAQQSPSACNRQCFEFKIFDEPELTARVAKMPFGASGYAHQIPTMVVVVGKLSSYFSPRDRHIIYIDSSMAAMSFMLALETLGLSSCVINWPDFEPLELKMQKKLGLDTSDRVVMLLAVGYADPNGGVPYSQKKDLNILRSYNAISKK